MSTQVSIVDISIPRYTWKRLIRWAYWLTGLRANGDWLSIVKTKRARERDETIGHRNSHLHGQMIIQRTDLMFFNRAELQSSWSGRYLIIFFFTYSMSNRTKQLQALLGSNSWNLNVFTSKWRLCTRINARWAWGRMIAKAMRFLDKQREVLIESFFRLVFNC